MSVTTATITLALAGSRPNPGTLGTSNVTITVASVPANKVTFASNRATFTAAQDDVVAWAITLPGTLTWEASTTIVAVLLGNTTNTATSAVPTTYFTPKSTSGQYFQDEANWTPPPAAQGPRCLFLPSSTTNAQLKITATPAAAPGATFAYRVFFFSPAAGIWYFDSQLRVQS